ncbi:MAG: hypothetical protein OES26_00115 [Gammaproteobacteria bacterium]|nr:hypothetical protein [Gammaproteobacteria bacterium]
MSERVVISKKLVMINSASSFATRLLSISVLIWLQQYLLKRISTEEYSLLPVLFSVMMFAPFITMALVGGISRYVLEAYAKEDDERVTQIVSTMFPILCAAGIGLFAAGVTFAWNIDYVFRIAPEYVDDARIMLTLLMFSAAIRLPVAAFGGGLFVRQRFVLQNLIELGTECFRLSLLLTLLFGLSTSVVWVVVATVAADLLNITAMTTVSRRLVPAQCFQRTHIRWHLARNLISFGGWNSLDGFSGMIRKAADPIILNRLATPLDVACFHLGALVPNRLEVIINNAFGNSVAPVIIGMHSLGQDERLKRTYLRLGRFALWGLLVVVAPFLVHFEQIVRLYVGDTYLAAGTVLFLLLAVYPIVYGNILHSVIATAKIRVRSLAIRNSVSTAANLPLTLLLVGHYQLGAIGAAAATFVTYGLGSLLLLWPFGKHIAGATWPEVWREILLPGFPPFFAALLVMNGLVGAFPAETWATLALNAFMGTCAYFTVLWFMMKDIDKRQLKEALRYILDRKWIRSRASLG